MRRLTLIASLFIASVVTVGCTHKQKDVDTRLADAEHMAAAAKAQADKSAARADDALRAATEAKRATQETSALMQLMLQNSGSSK